MKSKMLDVVVTDGNYSRQARQKFWGWILQNCYLLIKKKKKKVGKEKWEIQDFRSYCFGG